MARKWAEGSRFKIQDCMFVVNEVGEMDEEGTVILEQLDNVPGVPPRRGWMFRVPCSFADELYELYGDSRIANSESAVVVPSPRPEDGKEPPLPHDYHVLLDLMCKELSIPGSMTFWEAVAWVKRRLPENQAEVVWKLNNKVARALAILNDEDR